MSEPVVGIDLGTSNSVIATVLNGDAVVIPDRAGHRIFPSVVAYPEDAEVRVAHAARGIQLDQPELAISSAKRLIGRHWYSDAVQEARKHSACPLVRGDNDVTLYQPGVRQVAVEEAQAEVLRHLMKVAEGYLGTRPKRAVITVPANFNESQRQATRLAGELAGLDVLRILNEPTAAALAYGWGSGENARIAVFDLGGGTFDITYLEMRDSIFEVLSTAGDTFLGGDDIDAAIAHELASQLSAVTDLDITGDPRASYLMRLCAERMKVSLSTEDHARHPAPSLLPDGGPNVALRLNREDLRRILMPILQRTFLVCDQASQLAGLSVAELDRLILVGGSTRSPIVEELVTSYFRREAQSTINPDEVVALGAAIYAEAIGGEELDSDLLEELDQDDQDDEKILDDAYLPSPQGSGAAGPATHPPAPPAPPKSKRRHTGSTSRRARAGAPLLIDVVPRALGLRTAGGFMDVLVPRNSSLPTRQARTFTTSSENQTRVKLEIYEGEAKRAEENHKLGELILEGLRAAPRGEVSIDVQFVISTEGLLQVRAVDTGTGASQRAELYVTGGHGRRAIEAMKDRAEK